MPEFRSKNYKLEDTIAAIATFPAKSALGVIKVSGRLSLAIASKIFKPAKKKNIKKAKTHTLHYGWIVEKEEGKRKKVKGGGRRSKITGQRRKDVVVDEVLLSVMRKPSTYTREDIIEVSSHGGPAVLNKILGMILRKGARLALPGEFTYRALVGGRIDLFQAESIRGIVEARSENALASASLQLKGEATLKIKRLKEEIKEVFVQTESLINFPEEDIDSSLLGFSGKIDKLAKEVDNFIKASREGDIAREGFKCVICGKANAGKSTLFNCLLREERVIVSRLPGTTRDVIEESLNVRGVSLRLYDTAGILEPKDLIAARAVKKALNIFEESDLVILVLDGSRRLGKEDFFLIEKAKNKNVILVINKSDLPRRLNLKKVSIAGRVVVKMSALKNKGLGGLEEAIFNMAYKEGIGRENIIFFSRYQRQILEQVKSSFSQIKTFLKDGRPIDFINIELKLCLDNLGRLSGEIFSEEILESIFSNFCIGK